MWYERYLLVLVWLLRLVSVIVLFLPTGLFFGPLGLGVAEGLNLLRLFYVQGREEDGGSSDPGSHT